MKTYENGLSTRKIILDTCVRLFLKKGFHETSYDDICREAHVNRGSIYYHFKEKENIRYEVLWELIMQDRSFIMNCCPHTEYDIFLSLYLFWLQFFENPMIRKFNLDYYKDQPVYTPHSELGRFYRMIYIQMFEQICPLEKINTLSFASGYGHVHGLMQLTAADLSQYNAELIFRHCLYAVGAVLEIPRTELDRLWSVLAPDIRIINASDRSRVIPQLL